MEREGGAGELMKNEENDITGKLLYEQTLYNIKIFIIVFSFWQFLGFLLGIGGLNLGLRTGSLIWIILGMFLIIIPPIVILIMALSWLYSKIQVFEKGIVVPLGLIKNKANYKKYGIRGEFYPYEDLSEIKKLRNNWLYYKYKEIPDRAYIFTKKQYHLS